MIIRINGSIRRRPAASMTGAIGFFAPHHIMFKILLGIIIIFTASVHLMITHSLSSLIQYTDNADEGSGRLYPSSPISSRVLEERSFPRVSAFLQINTVILRNWTQSRRHVMDMANANVRAKIAMRDDLDLDVVETDTCKLPYTWQKSSFPSCNSIHEFDITSPWSIHSNGWRKLFRIIGNGFWRDVWLIQNDYAIASEKNILKTMRFGHEFSPRNFDRMRRDGVVMERLTKSPFVLNIYSFCGTTSITEYGDGGDIPDALWSEGRKSDLSQIEKLRIATQAAIALAAIHNIDREGHPSLAHTDISPAQFIKVKDVYKLNDFNRARFIAYNGNVSCPFSVGSNPGRNRSPEEYNYQPQTEKVDIYSLGNIFYMLLQGDWPFYDVPLETAYELVKNGTRPSIFEDLWYSTDPVNVALREAMIMCHEHYATDRPSARYIEQYLLDKIREVDPSFLDTWGFP